MALILNTAAASLPVTLAEAKLHLRVTGTDDDDLITAMLTVATANAEHIMGRALLPQKWKLTLDNFWGLDFVPGYLAGSLFPPYNYNYERPIPLPRPPVTAIDSLVYVDLDGATQTLNSSLYQLAAANDYGATVVPAYGEVWPQTRWQPEAVRIIFSCGYADAATVPAPVKAWIKMRVGATFENRESTVVVVGGRLTLVELPFVDTLLDPYRVWTAG